MASDSRSGMCNLIWLKTPLLFTVALLLTVFAGDTWAEARLPIIDMHLHARKADYIGDNPPSMCTPFEVMPRWDPAEQLDDGMTFNKMPPCDHPIPAARTDEDVLRQTIAVMNKRNIIGMVSGEPELMEIWKAAAPARVIVGSDLRISASSNPHVKIRTPDELRQLRARGLLDVLGEVMAQYEGITPDDARLEPYWALAESLEIPVGIHLGPGAPGDPYRGSPGYRARNSSALGLEAVLVKHPRLRVYIMHAGYPLVADLRALLFTHPQVYVDISSIVYTEPRAAFYRYLAQIVAAGYGDRVMFGSDQMIWPGIIEPSIEAIEQAPFLSEAQKRDILYNNAARFLRLTKDEIARHHSL
jgi:predicted TIM-barrel fold metal-dependent hydrolase